jgi:hypothetical protein
MDPAQRVKDMSVAELAGAIRHKAGHSSEARVQVALLHLSQLRPQTDEDRREMHLALDAIRRRLEELGVGDQGDSTRRRPWRLRWPWRRQ